uniref:Amino acid transporter n=1 Tax=Timema genevievae TaxID=629358 RepID=A0A7R9JVJ0_TIMGE|nr:unnamed protein product [Timema genevievae]
MLSVVATSQVVAVAARDCFRTMVSVFVMFVLRDRFRTTVNVLGDALGAGIVDHLSKGELARMTENVEELSDVEEHLMQPVGNKDNMALT